MYTPSPHGACLVIRSQDASEAFDLQEYMCQAGSRRGQDTKPVPAWAEGLPQVRSLPKMQQQPLPVLRAAPKVHAGGHACKGKAEALS